MALFDQIAKILGSNGQTVASVTSRGSKGAVSVELLDANGSQITTFKTPSFTIGEYDSQEITWNVQNNPTQILYKLGGTLVATVTITYDASGNPTLITKS